MKFDPCRICSTPGVKVSTDGYQVCPACGVSSLRDVALWMLERERKPIGFEVVNRKYRISRSVMSLGQWVMARNFRLAGRV